MAGARGSKKRTKIQYGAVNVDRRLEKQSSILWLFSVQFIIADPSLATIAKDTSMSKRTVQRALDDLIKHELITKEGRLCENHGTSSNNYTLTA